MKQIIKENCGCEYIEIFDNHKNIKRFFEKIRCKKHYIECFNYKYQNKNNKLKKYSGYFICELCGNKVKNITDKNIYCVSCINIIKKRNKNK